MEWKKQVGIFSLSIVISLLPCVFACSNAGPASQNSTVTSPSLVTIKDIFDGKADNKRVKIVGQYLGWAPCDVKKNQTVMLTRSDWVLSDGHRCIFVTGGIPKLMNPVQNSGKKLCIIADVHKVEGRYILFFRHECVIPAPKE